MTVKPMTPSPTIVVVSGLPRSGTSMMMAMLQAGGLPLLVDEYRAADVSNPLGYFEYEPAKRIERDQSWLPRAAGRAVKLISFHLYSLPRDFRYKVVFLERPIAEVLASQQAMLASQGLPPLPGDADLRRQFSAHLQDVRAWLGRQPHVEVRFVPHHRIIEAPHQTADETAVFLERDLDTDAMAKVVEPELWRQRS